MLAVLSLFAAFTAVDRSGATWLPVRESNSRDILAHERSDTNLADSTSYSEATLQMKAAASTVDIHSHYDNTDDQICDQRCLNTHDLAIHAIQNELSATVHCFSSIEEWITNEGDCTRPQPCAFRRLPNSTSLRSTFPL